MTTIPVVTKKAETISDSISTEQQKLEHNAEFIQYALRKFLVANFEDLNERQISFAKADYLIQKGKTKAGAKNP